MGQQPKGATGLLITGAGGRIGRALRGIWHGNRAGGLPILWHGRRAGPGVDLVWDIGANPPVELPKGLIILHLAGCTTGTPQDLAENSRVTQAVCRIPDVAHVLMMSSAAVYRPGPDLLTEGDLPDPISPYGQAKLAAEQVALGLLGRRVTLLRLANLAGADALLGNCGPGHRVTLDPIAGQSGGPQRSYIGPRVLADVLARLIGMADLPQVLNVAQPGIVSMAGLLDALGQPWGFGPPRDAAIARVAVATDLLAGIMPLPPAEPAGLIADMTSIPGWPR